MDILQIAIDAEGGVGRLAAALGESQSVVSNWRARRLPRPWQKVLAMKYGNALPAVSTTELAEAQKTPAAQQTHAQPAIEAVATGGA